MAVAAAEDSGSDSGTESAVAVGGDERSVLSVAGAVAVEWEDRAGVEPCLEVTIA